VRFDVYKRVDSALKACVNYIEVSSVLRWVLIEVVWYLFAFKCFSKPSASLLISLKFER